MNEFPINDLSAITLKLHNMQKDKDFRSDYYVYSVQIDPSSCSFTVHVNHSMFKEMVTEKHVVETSFNDIAVHLSATVDGSINLVCCVLRSEMLTSEDDNNKCIQQLYDEWVERTGWPYA